jgi:16S rRNA (guanine(527)-N(7))-methyltransferase RsmG
MDPARISELLKPFLADTPNETKTDDRESAVLSPDQLNNISMYIDILLHWNARINLTAIRQPDEIVTRHFGESLFAARHLFPPTATISQPSLSRNSSSAEITLSTSKPRSGARMQPTAQAVGGEPKTKEPQRGERPSTTQALKDTHNPSITLIDVGSGAGFPGLPIKIWAPEIHLTMIESNQKKSTFLREVVRALTLININVFSKRAEDHLAHQANIVTLRAVENFQAALPTAIRLLASGGRLTLLISEAQQAKAQALAPDLTWNSAVQVPLSTNRILLIGTKSD